MYYVDLTFTGEGHNSAAKSKQHYSCWPDVTLDAERICAEKDFRSHVVESASDAILLSLTLCVMIVLVGIKWKSEVNQSQRLQIVIWEKHIF